MHSVKVGGTKLLVNQGFAVKSCLCTCVSLHEYTSLTAYTIVAKLTNRFQRTRLLTPSTNNHYSFDSGDDLRSGCRTVSHQQQFFLELPSPGRSHYTN